MYRFKPDLRGVGGMKKNLMKIKWKEKIKCENWNKRGSKLTIN